MKPHFFVPPFHYEIKDEQKKQLAIVESSGSLNKFTTYYDNTQRIKSNIKDVIIPEIVGYNGQTYTITYIGNGVFDNSTNIETIQIPATVTIIEWSFWKCFNLKAIRVDRNNLKYCDIDGVLYDKNKTKLIAYPNAKSSSYQVPNGVLEIGNMAFKSCTNIESIILPDTIVTIGINVFYDCIKLKRIVLPNTLKNFEPCNCDNSKERTKTIFEYKGVEYNIDEIEALFEKKKIVK